MFPLKNLACKDLINMNHKAEGLDIIFPNMLSNLSSCLLLQHLTHLPLDKMSAVSQTIFSDAFSWMKSLVFWLKFHWSLLGPIDNNPALM